MFLYCVYVYILFSFISTLVFNFSLYFNLILFFSIAYLIYKFKHTIYCNVFILCFFISIALLIVSLHHELFINKPIEKDTGLISFYAKVKNFIKKENKNYIYLTDLYSYKNIELPQNIKLRYKGYQDVKCGDIVKVNAFLFSTKNKNYPYGFDFNLNALNKNNDANGFIVGQINLIENFNHQLNFFTKINAFFDNISSNMIKKIQNTDLKYSGFLIAISLGDERYINKNDMISLRNSSLSHLISISGYHISLLTGFIFFSIRFLLNLIPQISLQYSTKKISATITIAVLLFYIIILKFPIPASRATIMSIAIMVGILCNFKTITINSLFLAAFILIMINPYSIYSAGFLLSFYATMSILIFTNIFIIKKLYVYIQSKNFLNKAIYIILSSMLLTLFIEISIFPILAFYFGQIPLMGMFSNALATPIFSFIIMPMMFLYVILPDFIANNLIHISNFGVSLLMHISYYISNLSNAIMYTPFFPSYLVIIFCFMYLLIPAIKGKIQYLYTLLVLCIPLIYFINHKYPDIMISNNYSLIAFKISNDTYLLSNNKNKFIEKNWFLSNNYKIIYNTKKHFKCDEKENCIININDITIALNKNNYNTIEDCNNSNLILSFVNTNNKCLNNTIIDKEYINKHKTTFIYFNKNKKNFYFENSY